MDSYRRISREAELLAGVIIKRLRHEGCTDEEIVQYLKAIVSPAAPTSSAVSSAIGKALRNPGFAVRISDEGTRVTDHRPFALIHHPSVEVPTGDPRNDLAKSLFDPKRMEKDTLADMEKHQLHKARANQLDAADQHDLTARIRKRRAKEQG